ncbi:unnamed protein product [Blepharisma stoltei]|uniref:PUM-HD domain-containing protein n=1 Tax=Blepharisma stoltei TaxID=1481888 RepID=A0AAU9IZ95_9CILI|nr:unnamed protein product [Blepharisma stoltei]
MSVPYSPPFLDPGEVALSRSISAPPSLDSNMLFAFPVASEYSSAFSDIWNIRSIKEKSESPDDKYTLSTQFSDTSSSDKLQSLDSKPRTYSSLSDYDENQSSTLSTSHLVNDIVDQCIKDEEQPAKNGFFNPFSSGMTDFNNHFPPEYYSNYSQFTPQHIYTQALEMAKDQFGCRLLQKKLEERNPFTLQTIYDQIAANISDLMLDPFGNYLFQKLIEVCEEPTLGLIIQNISEKISTISLSAHGTRAVQKLIDIATTSSAHIEVIVKGLKERVIDLIKDINGNHVIQKCLHTLGAANNQFIYVSASSNVIDIATHRHGCCVLQRCIDAASPEQLEMLIDKILENAVVLVQDAFGNYVVQYVIDLNRPDVNARLAQIFMASIQELSTQKFSSNVIEKCLQQNKGEIQQAMIQEIGKPNNLAKMISDQYANYVVQRALSLASPQLLKKMLKEVKSLLEELKRSPFGKRIYSKLVKTYPELENQLGFSY